MSTSPATPGPDVSRTPSTNLLSSVIRAFSSMASGTNRNPPSEENVSVEEDPDGNISAEDDPGDNVASRVQSEGISMIHRMQRVIDRLEREAENLLDNPQRQMDEFRTLGSASENVLAAHLFHEQQQSNGQPRNRRGLTDSLSFPKEEEDVTSAEGSSDRKFIGSEPKSIRLKTEFTKCSSPVDQVGPVLSGGTRSFSSFSPLSRSGWFGGFRSCFPWRE